MATYISPRSRNPDCFVSEQHEFRLALTCSFKEERPVRKEIRLNSNGSSVHVSAVFVGNSQLTSEQPALCLSASGVSGSPGVEARVRAIVADTLVSTPISFSTPFKLTQSLRMTLQDVMNVVDRSGGLLEIVIQVQIKEVMYLLDEKEEVFPKYVTEMLKSGDFSDFEVVCSKYTFKCHKLVLAARSEYFRTLLSSEFKEARENRLVVNEVEPEAMEAVLHFIYSGELSEDKTSVGVLELAHLYGLHSLVRQCCNELAFAINMETIYVILPTAFVLDKEFLFRHALAFFKKNRDEIMIGEDWNAMTSNTAMLTTFYKALSSDLETTMEILGT